MPGYEITASGDVLVNFGNYADIHDAYTPEPDCPLPENERLANYLMRLLAIMEQGGWRLVQRNEQEEKETRWKLWNTVDSILSEATAANSYISYIGDTLNACLLSLQDVIVEIDDVGDAVSTQGAEWVIRAAEILVSLEEIITTLMSIKEAIDGIEGADVASLVAKLSDIFELDGLSVLVRDHPELGFQSIPDELLGEAEIANNQEGVLEIGGDGVFLKSKIVRSH